MVGVVFLVSSMSKLAGRHSFRSFVAALAEMRVLPAGLVLPVAVLVVAGELSVWLLLAVPVAAVSVAGLAAAIGLLVAFTVGIGSVLKRGLPAACRCFGPTAAPFGSRHIVRNAVLICVAAIGTVTWIRSGPAPIGGLLVALAAGLLIGGLVAVLDDLIDLFRPVSSAGPRRREMT
jgi:hypothetical protein